MCTVCCCFETSKKIGLPVITKYSECSDKGTEKKEDMKGRNPKACTLDVHCLFQLPSIDVAAIAGHWEIGGRSADFRPVDVVPDELYQRFRFKSPNSLASA